jgi:hypothetical protein
MSIWVELSDNNERVCKPEYFKKYVIDLVMNITKKYLLRCVSRVNKTPPYSVILVITVLLNGFIKNKSS